MSNPYGVMVKHDGLCWLFTTSQDAEETTRRLGVLEQQMTKRLAKHRLLLAKTQAAAQEMHRREAAGKARRPARKTGA